MRGDDRTVHAAYEGTEIVRYDRTGKWYAEPTDGKMRQRLTVKEAAMMAKLGTLNENGLVWYGKHGGTVFERELRRVRV